MLYLLCVSLLEPQLCGGGGDGARVHLLRVFGSLWKDVVTTIATGQEAFTLLYRRVVELTMKAESKRRFVGVGGQKVMEGAIVKALVQCAWEGS
ncbi:hypothetical protein EYF80_004963 [Liparis tanakae]|uniref:Uncharacterized protein n=1 Tax=Liparis tanakae TaxID=230148 RepID=A0A4Z2J5I9_9TELE|nr:hypothetical protein EYF80_004963 [Liparis tanakae]